MTTESTKTTAKSPKSKEKETYVSPKLRRLGNVRDITLGSTSGATEFGMMA